MLLTLLVISEAGIYKRKKVLIKKYLQNHAGDLEKVSSQEKSKKPHYWPCYTALNAKKKSGIKGS